MSASLNKQGIEKLIEGKKAMPGKLGLKWGVIPNDLLASVANYIAKWKYSFNEEKVKQLKPLAEKYYQGEYVRPSELAANRTNEQEIEWLVKAYKALTAVNGWSADTLAAVADVSVDTVRRIENQRKEVSRKTIKKVTQVLGFEPDDYIEKDDLSLQELWQRLQQQATPTNLMGAVLAQPKTSTLGARPIRDNPYLHVIPFDSAIEFHLNFGSTGHLMLLEREPSGAIVCLCPSEYAPDTETTGETFTLPQSDSPVPYFGATEAGCEQYIALLCQDLLPLSWLEQSRHEALELNEGHLQELLEHLEQIPDKQLYRTEYTVQAQIHR